MEDLKIYWRFILIYLKCRMEYRFAFFMDIFMPVFSYTINYFTIWIILNRFNSIRGWGFDEIMFLYTINLFSYGLAGIIFYTPMASLDNLVRQGKFDMFLTKPMNPFLHLISRQFEHIFIGHLILSSIVLVTCLSRLGIIWSGTKIIWLIFILFGATLIQASVMIITGCLSFWYTNSTSVASSILNSLRGFINYPISIYNKGLRILLTFILPYGFISFYPSQYFLNKTDVIFHPLFQYGTPIVGILFFILAYKIWLYGVDHYNSAGA
ncbi:ABC transporter permease [Dethiothermospora halolimnae]|uniref:ABC transporter permease n=1 Tax=Dethiothermospora halolimnae TaxID=3114390 RepID=UPI003CCBA8CF